MGKFTRRGSIECLYTVMHERNFTIKVTSAGSFFNVQHSQTELLDPVWTPGIEMTLNMLLATKVSKIYHSSRHLWLKSRGWPWPPLRRRHNHNFFTTQPILWLHQTLLLPIYLLCFICAIQSKLCAMATQGHKRTWLLWPFAPWILVHWLATALIFPILLMYALCKVCRTGLL